MPTQTPQKPASRAKAVHPFETIDWLALWAVSLGLSAMVLAGIAYFTIGDNLGASFILASAAAIIGTTMLVSKPPVHE